MKNLQFISRNEHFKKEKRDKLKKLYFWHLERYNPNVELEFAMDVLPKQPKNHGLQLMKFEIISELNTRNIFDFKFEPQNEDFLRLQNIRHSDDFLTLSFYNGNWKENIRFSISNRDQIIHKGIFELV